MSAVAARSDAMKIQVLDGADDKQLGLIVELLRLIFPNTYRSIDTFLWKHFENPRGPSIVTYAVDSSTGQLAGVRAFWRCDLWYNGKKLVSYQPCDTATHPDFRRFGLFTRMTLKAVAEAEQRGAQLLFNFPNSQSRPAYLKLGWTCTNQMVSLLRPIRYLRILQQVLRVKDPTMRKFSASPEGAVAADWCVINYPEVERARWATNVYSTLPDQEYVNWRYRRHPYVNYGVTHDGETSLVYRTGTRGALREAQVIDVIDPMNSCEAGRLKRLIRNLVEQEQADVITAMISRGNPARAAFYKVGFFNWPNQVTLAYRYCTGAATGGLATSFALCAGDVDTF